jgi:hypothetical protein
MDQSATNTYQTFATRVMSAVRSNIANAECFNEQDVADIFEHVEDALVYVDPAKVRVSPEAYAARLLHSTAMIVSYRPGWRNRRH